MQHTLDIGLSLDDLDTLLQSCQHCLRCLMVQQALQQAWPTCGPAEIVLMGGPLALHARLLIIIKLVLGCSLQSKLWQECDAPVELAMGLEGTSLWKRRPL